MKAKQTQTKAPAGKRPVKQATPAVRRGVAVPRTKPVGAPPVRQRSGASGLLEPRWTKTKDRFYDVARTLFVEQGKTQEEVLASGLIRISRATLAKWRRAGGWVAERQKKLTGPQARLTTVERALEAVLKKADEKLDNHELPWPTFADDVSKLVAALKNLRGDVFFAAHLVTTMDLYAEYLAVSGKAEQRRELAEMLEGFVTWALAKR